MEDKEKKDKELQEQVSKNMLENSTFSQKIKKFTFQSIADCTSRKFLNLSKKVQDKSKHLKGLIKNEIITSKESITLKFKRFHESFKSFLLQNKVFNSSYSLCQII